MLLFQRGRGCAAGSAHTVMQRNNAAAHGTGIFLPFILQKDGKPACENGAAVGQKTGVVARTIAFFQTVQAPAGERGAFKAIAQALFTAAVPDGTGTAVTRLAFVPVPGILHRDARFCKRYSAYSIPCSSCRTARTYFREWHQAYAFRISPFRPGGGPARAFSKHGFQKQQPQGPCRSGRNGAVPAFGSAFIPQTRPSARGLHAVKICGGICLTVHAADSGKSKRSSGYLGIGIKSGTRSMRESA